jgi:hypothetical protein
LSPDAKNLINNLHYVFISQPFDYLNTTCKDGSTISGAERNKEIMEDESRNNGDSGSGPVDTETAVGQDQVQDALNESAECDPSTPPLFGAPAGIDEDTEAQETATVPSEDESPPLTRQDRVLIVLTIALLIASLVVQSALDVTGADPLAFKRLAWYSTCISSGIATLMVQRHRFIPTQ